MAKLSDDEQATLDTLLAKKDAPDEPDTRHQQRTDVRVTIDLNDETQVKRAVRSGLLPASYLEDDDDDDGKGGKDDDDDDPDPDAAPNRRMDRRFG